MKNSSHRLILLLAGFLTVVFFQNCSELESLGESQPSSSNDPDINPPPPPTLSDVVKLSDFNLPAQNANGWTLLQPETSSRIVYVDSTAGNDNTGQVYSPSDNVVGNNPQLPSGTVQAYRSLAAAFAQLRDDQPDWMLLKAGGVWTGQQLNIRKGTDAARRAVVSSYGTGARPELRTGAEQGIRTSNPSNVIISGIKFWAHTRDTDGAYFQSYDGTTGFNFYNKSNIDDVLIEDCFFRSYSGNVITGRSRGPGTPTVSRLAIRRSIISGNFSTTSHSQGLYYSGAGQPLDGPPSVLLEGNFFDHNGWRIQSINADNSRTNGQATYYNHNTYFNDAKRVLFTGNIFMRASSMQNKWTSNAGPQSTSQVVISDNLYIEGEIGISAGGNESGAYRFERFEIKNNVMTDVGRARPTNRNLAWYMGIQDWDNGIISGNLLLNQTSTELRNVYAINFMAVDAMRNVDITNNYIYNIESNRSLISFSNGANTSNVNFADNIVQVPLSGVIADMDAKGGYQFSGGNQYFSSAASNQWFETNNSNTDLAGWVSYTGDSNAVASEVNWTDPDRNIERYSFEAGLGNNFNNFIEALYSQSKSRWRTDLTALAINNWFRQGFVE